MADRNRTDNPGAGRARRRGFCYAVIGAPLPFGGLEVEAEVK